MQNTDAHGGPDRDEVLCVLTVQQPDERSWDQRAPLTSTDRKRHDREVADRHALARVEALARDDDCFGRRGRVTKPQESNHRAKRKGNHKA